LAVVEKETEKREKEQEYGEKNNLVDSFRPPTIPFSFLSHHFLLQAGSALFHFRLSLLFNHFFLTISPVLSPLFVFSFSLFLFAISHFFLFRLAYFWIQLV